MNPDSVIAGIAGFALGFVCACLLLSCWPPDEAEMRRVYLAYRLWRRRRS